MSHFFCELANVSLAMSIWTIYSMSLQNSGLGAMQGVLQEQNNHPKASSQDGTPSTVPELPTALPLAPLTDTYTAVTP